MTEEGSRDDRKWEQTAKRATAMLLGEQTQSVTEQAAGVEESLRHGETPSDDDLIALRTEVLMLQRIVEECLIPHVSNTEPWELLEELSREP